MRFGPHNPRQWEICQPDLALMPGSSSGHTHWSSGVMAQKFSPVRQTATGVFNLLREGAVGFGLQLQGCLPSGVFEVWVLALT